MGRPKKTHGRFLTIGITLSPKQKRYVMRKKEGASEHIRKLISAEMQKA